MKGCHLQFVLLFPLFLAFGASCAGIQPGRSIQLGQDSVVKIGRQKPITLKKGAAIKVNEDPILVEAPGYISVLVIPAAAPPQKMNLDLRTIEKWGGAALEKQSANVTNLIVNLVIETQILIATRQEKMALTKLEIAQKDFPNITAFKYLKANCYLLMNDQRQARTILQEALRGDPDNKIASDLYRSLGGETPNRSISSLPKTNQIQGGSR